MLGVETDMANAEHRGLKTEDRMAADEPTAGPTKRALEVLVEDFLQYLRHERGQSDHTQKTYAALLGKFPEGYRHLGYLQSKIGYKIKDELPGLDGPPLEALYAKGEEWLKGKKL